MQEVLAKYYSFFTTNSLSSITTFTSLNILMKNSPFSIICIILSCLLAVVVMKINHDIALQYLRSDGKTKGLFGLVEILTYGYQYYLVAISLLEIVLLIFAFRRREERVYLMIAIILLVISTGLLFGGIWRWMI